MSFNLLEMIQNQVVDTLANKASSLLGESQSNTTKALSGILPTLMGSLISKGSDSSGASGLLKMITDGGFDGSMLNNVSGLLGSQNDTNQLTQQGQGILDSLIGDKLGGVVDMISGFSGVSKGSSKSLMSMAAPMLMSAIGKKVMGDKLDASGLMGLLSSQKDHVKAAMPGGLQNKLGGLLGLGSILGIAGDAIKGVGNTAKDVAETAASTATEAVSAAGDAAASAAKTVGKAATSAANTAGDVASSAAKGAKDTATVAAKKGGSFLRWLLPILLVAVAVAFLIRSCGGTGVDAIDNTADKVMNTTEKTVDGVAKTTGKVVDGAVDVTKMSAKAIAKAVTAFATGINDLIKSDDPEAVVNFNALRFETGSATISSGTAQEIEKLAEILKANKNVHVQIEGHTDNTGSAATNMKLSQDRANAVVTMLNDLGISANRLSAKGYGSTKPIASNDTEKGRDANRRISVKVTKR